MVVKTDNTIETLEQFNKLTRAQMQEAFDVGETLIDAIIEKREQSGALKSFDELMDVPGMTRELLDTIRHTAADAHAAADQGLQEISHQVEAQTDRAAQLVSLWFGCINEQFQANLKAMSMMINSTKPADLLARQGEYLSETQARWARYASEVSTMSRDAMTSATPKASS